MLQLQSNMQSMLVKGYVWSFKACTSASSGPALSAKEKRCIQQGVANYFDAMGHIGQTLAASKGE